MFNVARSIISEERPSDVGAQVRYKVRGWPPFCWVCLPQLGLLFFRRVIVFSRRRLMADSPPGRASNFVVLSVFCNIDLPSGSRSIDSRTFSRALTIAGGRLFLTETRWRGKLAVSAKTAIADFLLSSNRP